MSSTALIAVMLLAAAQPASAPSAAPPARTAPSPVLYLVEYRQGPRWNPPAGGNMFAQPGMREHVAHFRALGPDLLGAAPVRPRTDGVLGYVLRRAASLEEAEAWLARDPAVVAGTMSGVVREWSVSSVAAWPPAS